MLVHTVQAGDNGVLIYDADNGASGLRRMSQASRAQALILRAFRPLFWMQAALGVAKLSVRKGVAVSKSSLSRSYNFLAVSLGVFISYYNCYHLQLENYNVAMTTLFTSVMVLTTIYYLSVLCVSKHTGFLNLFKDLSTFDDNVHASLNSEYERSLNGTLNWVIICAYGLVYSVRFTGAYFIVSKIHDLVFGFISLWMMFGVEVELMYCWVFAKQVSGRVRMLRVGLEQCLGGFSLDQQCSRRGEWLRSRLSREEVHSLGCRVSLVNLPTLYNTIHGITRGINSSFMLAVIIVMINFIIDSTIITIIVLTFEADTEIKRVLSIFIISMNIVKMLVILTAVCVAYERVAIQRSRLLSLLALLSLDSSSVHPGRARRARNIARAVICHPLSFSLCGVELRATFIPTLLSLLIDCALLHFQITA